MRRLALLAGLALASCGSSEPPALPPACAATPRAIVDALATAPGPVALRDGTPLSDCVAKAFDDGALQQIGFAFTPAAYELSERGTRPAALQLGFLIGAARRGAATTNGIHLELVRKLEGTARGVGDPALDEEVRRGIAAGEARG